MCWFVIVLKTLACFWHECEYDDCFVRQCACHALDRIIFVHFLFVILHEPNLHTVITWAPVYNITGWYV